MPGEPLVTLRSYLHRDEADVVRVRLHAAGIDAIVTADDEGGLSPGFFTNHRVRLSVRRDDLQLALGEIDPDLPSLSVKPAALEAMMIHARFCDPLEGCGLIARDRSEPDTVAMVYCLSNLDQSPTRFTVAPAEHFGALRHAERNGWTIGGSFHSHPKAEPFPSPTDVRGALDPEWVYFIVGPTRSPSVRAWTIQGGVVRDVLIRS